MAKKLIISSPDNEDWNGTWLKGEAEREMKDLLCEPKAETDWIEWVLGHAIDAPDFKLETEIATDPAIRSITLLLDDGELTIQKV